MRAVVYLKLGGQWYGPMSRARYTGDEASGWRLPAARSALPLTLKDCDFLMARIGIDARLTYYRQGGISQYIYHLIEGLPAEDPADEYLIIHSRKDRRNLAQAPNQARRVAWTPAHHRFERLTLGLETLPMRLDLLHSPDFIPPLNRFQRALITVHDLTFLHYPHTLTTESRRYYNDQIAAAVSRAQHILTDSDASRDDIIRLLGVAPQKVTRVYLGVDAAYRPLPPAEVAPVLARHGLDRAYLLAVGTIEPRKNLAGLFEAYARLRDSGLALPDLVLVGAPGWLVEQIEEAAERLRLGERLRWLGQVPAGDLPALYNGAALLCTPSFYEGFGLPPLEAMACGTPAIVARRGSLIEIAGDAALLIDPDDSEDLAGAIRRVLEDQTLVAGMRARGLAWVRRFNWADAVRETARIYRQVLEES